MMQRPGQQQPGGGPAQILQGLADVVIPVFRRLGGGGIGIVFLGLLAVVFTAWVGSGVYTVSPSEQAALRFFGKFTSTAGPGLHWYWPAPIGTRNIEAVTAIKRMTLGFVTSGTQGTQEVPIEALMITGDENIVDVQMVVQYRISDLGSFLFKVSDPGELVRGIEPGRPDGRTLKDAAEAALRQVVGQREIDEVLTVGKEVVQGETRLLLQRLLDHYDVGLEVTEVKLQNVRPPAPVRDAFDDVVRAKEDRERTINEADAYKEDILPKARGEAAKIVQGAEAYKAAQIAKATGETSRFLSVLEEYQKAPDVTRIRLYLEAMEEVLPGITKFIVGPDTGGNLLQLLDLEP